MTQDKDPDQEDQEQEQEPEAATESVYEAVIIDNRTGERAAGQLFDDPDAAKEYLEEYALIRLGLTGGHWRDQETPRDREKYHLYLGDGDARAVVAARPIHADADQLLETTRAIQAEVTVDAIA